MKKENEKLLQLEQESDKKVEIVQPNTSSKAFSMSRMLSNAFDTTPEQVIAHSYLLTHSLTHTYSLTHSYSLVLRTESDNGRKCSEEYKN